MGALVFIVGSLMASAALLSILGLTVGDFRDIRKQAKYRPGRTNRRRRPLVSVIIRDEIGDKYIASIRHSTYPKKEIILAGERVRGTFVLLPVKAHIFEPATLGNAIRQLEQDPSRPTIEILRAYKPPQTLPELLRTYHDIVVAPFIAVRQAFHVTLLQTRWSLLIRPSVPRNKRRARLYCGFRFLVSCANCLALAYVCYVAAVLYQPEYLQTYLGGFGVWLILAICHYAHFSIRQKTAYIILAPVSFGYFAVLALYAPFSPLVRRIRAATGGLVWRSSHQSWA